jgi:hypothetical protein
MNWGPGLRSLKDDLGLERQIDATRIIKGVRSFFGPTLFGHWSWIIKSATYAYLASRPRLSSNQKAILGDKASKISAHAESGAEKVEPKHQHDWENKIERLFRCR